MPTSDLGWWPSRSRRATEVVHRPATTGSLSTGLSRSAPPGCLAAYGRTVRHDEESRADVARRRLAQLAASFDGELSPSTPVEPGVRPRAEPAHARRRLESSHVRVVLIAVAAGAVLLVWWLLAGRPQSESVGEPLALATASAPASAGDAAASGEPPELVIDVAGKVERPGIVTLPAGSRVHEAIDAAGGLAGDVDTTALNLARELSDGEQVLVGVEAVPGPPGASGPGAAPAPVNLNTATLEQLDTLPGVGPVTAQAIIAWRVENGRFASVDQLLDVKGIGDATLAELRDLVTV